MSCDTILFQSDIVTVGSFRCSTEHTHFEDTGPIRDYMIVFPRTSVWITHAGKRPVVANPNVVMFYNKAQEYRRNKISERGDFCDWFVFHPRLIVEAIKPYDPSAVEREETPFVSTHGPSDPKSYLLQRLVVQLASKKEKENKLFIEESLCQVLHGSIKNAYIKQKKQPGKSRRSTARHHADLAENTKAFLAKNYSENLSLSEIAHAVHSSPFHLCRVFQKETKYSLHEHRNQIRLRTSLERILDGHPDLTELGLELGYSSHSHFTHTFRKTFGTPPSLLKNLPLRRLHHLQKTLPPLP